MSAPLKKLPGLPVAVRLFLLTGTSIDCLVHVPTDLRLSDVLNDRRAFLPIKADNREQVVAKRLIGRALPIGRRLGTERAA